MDAAPKDRVIEVERAVRAEREACLSVISGMRDHWRAAEKEWSSASNLRDLQSFLVGKAAKHKADFADEIMVAIRALPLNPEDQDKAAATPTIADPVKEDGR